MMGFNDKLPWSSLLADEISHCNRLIPAGYYPHTIQLGLSQYDYLSQLNSNQNVFVERPESNQPIADYLGHHESMPDIPYHQVFGGSIDAVSNVTDTIAKATDSEALNHRILSEFHQLPFDKAGVDLAVLPHVLECAEPHQVLREVAQVLSAEGIVVITGFNPVSFLRVRYRLGSRRDGYAGMLYPMHRVQDWMSLLGFELVGAGLFCYYLPLKTDKWRRRMLFIEKAGNRWWPIMAGVYVIVGKKRVAAMRLNMKKAKTWPNFLPGLTPASRSANRVEHK